MITETDVLRGGLQAIVNTLTDELRERYGPDERCPRGSPTRADGTCAICFGRIQAGARVRARTERSDEQRKVMTFKFCAECCRAMAVSDEWPEILEHRYALGQATAETARRGDARAR